MKNIIQYLTEKLHISNDAVDTPKNQDNSSSNVKVPHITLPSNRDMEKMKAYMAKGSDPRRLVNDIKDRVKLEGRFVASTYIKWGEAVQEFGKGLINRGYFTREELNAWLEKNNKPYSI